MDRQRLKTEAHLHLYGCLSACDLYEMGRDRHIRYESRMAWFVAKYEKAYGIRPDYNSWWTSATGFEDFQDKFEFRAAGSFQQFQAKFNLLIALNPPNPNDFDLVERVFASDAAVDASREYRTFLPHYMPEPERHQYVLGLLERARDARTSGYRPLIAFSLARDPTIYPTAYEWLKSFTSRHPWTFDIITGIDFCGSETGHYPELFAPFINKISEDNTTRSKPWQVLYHVGETWEDMSLASSARWVVQAVQLGVRRIGHGLALGVDPTILEGQLTPEPAAEFKRHLAWLSTYQPTLSEFGYGKIEMDWYRRRGLASLQNAVVHWHWDRELCDHVKCLQSALMDYTRRLDPLIEVCVTSNMRISRLPKPSVHPLRRFLDHGLRLTAATDDPGIFNLNLQEEETLLRQHHGCTPSELEGFEREAQRALNYEL